MAAAFAASDLVVSRAGASVSETVACGLPSILVPFPHAASNHQEHNARSLERAGAATVILERDLNAETLARSVEGILFNEDVRRGMRRAAAALARPDAAAAIAQRLINLKAT
jgi:UDP-N-acetylglucosamine--N-acetylmuramyl-(pentapeptide) pyrophosphoryl-undecaprenol N-acetylglucosamine transferase